MTDEPIPGTRLAEALAEIERLRARIVEYEATHGSDLEYLAGLQDRIKAREGEFVEFGRMQHRILELEAVIRSHRDAPPSPYLVDRVAELQARILELEAELAITHGSLAQPTPDEPATYIHDVPPNAPR